MADLHKKGWVDVGFGGDEYYIRTSYDNLAYGEVKKDGVTHMSPATILAGYLTSELSMYGVEHSISTLRFERRVAIVMGSGIRTPLTSNSRGWAMGLSRSDLYTAPVEIVLKYKHVKIENELGDSDYFPDFYMSILISHDGSIKLTGWRQEVQYSHVRADYMHSHLDNYDYTDPFEHNLFCTGTSDTPVEGAIIDTSSFLKEHACDLTKHLYDRRRKPVPNLAELVDELEFKANNLVAVLMPLLTTESTEGVPYCYLKYNAAVENDHDGDDEMYDLDDSRIIDFAKLVCDNIHDSRIKFQMTADNITIKDSPSLCEFAKEHGYYEDIMAVYKPGDYAGFNQSVVSLPDIDLKTKVEIDIKLGMLMSPFTWNGKRLRCFATNLNTTKINKTNARIHEFARDLFDIEVKDFFKDRLMRRVLRRGVSGLEQRRGGGTGGGESRVLSPSKTSTESAQPVTTTSDEVSPTTSRVGVVRSTDVRDLWC